jgi:ABC-type nitrate/sulfonate/bicarbonate transport system permease component
MTAAVRAASSKRSLPIFLVSLASFLIAWYVASRIADDTIILATPIQVFDSLVGLFRNEIPVSARGTADVYTALAQTLGVMFAGFGLGVIVGVPIGLIMGMRRSVEGVLSPWVTLAAYVPIVSLIPVFYFVVGANLLADIFVAFLLSVFSVTVNTQNGVRSVSQVLAEAGRSFGASRVQFATKVVLPAALPDIIAGMRIGAGRALLGTVLAETLLSRDGLGGMMTTYQQLFDTPYMMASVVLIALIGISLQQIPRMLERRLFRWREAR